MRSKIRLVTLALVVVSLPVLGGQARAERLRYHYSPVDACGRTVLQPCGPCSAPGERIAWFGSVREPAHAPPQPTVFLTYCHPYTGQPLVLPVNLPDSTPLMQHRGQRIIYSYGDYSVEVQFLPDGSADVIYNSPLRRLP